MRAIPISIAAKTKLVEWDNKYRENFDRMEWDEYFLILAHNISCRSHDVQTQCGAIIVGKNNEILSTGYNGFMGGIDDSVLPNLRPEKYTWMIHAEHNAVLHCARNGICIKGATIYVTHYPCIKCLQYVWQAGIVKVVCNDKQVNTHSDDAVDIEIFLHLVMGKFELQVINN